MAGALLLGQGCSGTGGAGPTSTVHPVGDGQMVAQAAGPQGATVSLEGTTLQIPAGALPSSEMITITSTTQAPPVGVTNLSPIYQFGPAGLVFASPVTVKLSFSGNVAQPIIVWSTKDGTGFETVPTTVEGGVASGQVTHFSEGFVADSATIAALPSASASGGDSGAVVTADGGMGSSPQPTVDGGMGSPQQPTADAGAPAPEDASTPSPRDAGSTVLTDSGAARSDGGGGGATTGGGSCPVCAAGFCSASCPSGSTACGGGDGGTPACVDMMTDPTNCGACGHACPQGEGCSAGQCSTYCYGSSTGGFACGSPSMPDGGVNCSSCAGTTACNGICVTLSSDPNNCGACGNVCAAGESCTNGSCTPLCAAGEVCAAGLCAAECPVGQTSCGSQNGTKSCVLLSSDPANCGACGSACGASEACVDGACVASCGAGAGAADAGVASGGGPTLPDGGVNCSYSPGTSACGSSCVNLESDPGNCGACAHACTEGQVCSAGSCGPICPGGGACANGLCATGCPTGTTACGGGNSSSTAACVDTMTDSRNCGGCGVACADGEVCAGGTCQSTCGSNSYAFGCGGPQLSDGGVDCSYCNGTTACGNACVALETDTSNCGECGHTCGAGQVCTNGTCGPMCASGDVCANGVCLPSCPTGTALCQAAAAGVTAFCSDTQTDSNNCGTCGHACGSGMACVDGACVGTCAWGGAAIDASAPATTGGGGTSSAGGGGGAIDAGVAGH